MNPKSTFDDMVLFLAQKLGLHSVGKNGLEMIDSVKCQLEKMDENGKRAILIIDEAHLLSDSTLEDIRVYRTRFTAQPSITGVKIHFILTT